MVSRVSSSAKQGLCLVLSPGGGDRGPTEVRTQAHSGWHFALPR